MEFTPRMLELYEEMRGTNPIAFIKAVRNEFGLSLGEAKEILVKLDYGEEWTLERYEEQIILPIIKQLEENGELQ